MGKKHVGHQARLMSQAMRKLTSGVSESGTMVIFINQIRMKIGVRFGSPETTSGGRALKFYCSVRMDIRRIGAVKDGSDVIGNKTRVRVKKNKVAPPFKDAEFDIIYGEGISALGELIDLGTEYDIIEKRGSWYSYDDDTIAQGRESTKEWLEENDEVRQHVKYLIRKELGMVSEEEQIEVEGEESLEEEGAEGEGVAEEA